MVRYPLGGNLSWALQWLVGFQRLGHDVYMVEKAGYSNACFDPSQGVMTDDCTYGTRAVTSLLGRFGLEHRWCYVDGTGRYHGVPRPEIERVFRSADLFLDVGTHGAWQDEAAGCVTARVDGEPGYTQMKWEAARRQGAPVPQYARYYSNGMNIGTPRSSAPTAGVQWRGLYSPVVTDLFVTKPTPAAAPYTTVMNWQAHDPFVFDGVVYGQKDVEFDKFIGLPRQVAASMEIGVAGSIPRARLIEAGWAIQPAHEVSSTYDRFAGYLADSRGEFSVCKHGYVALKTGWFSDRSAAYLASGRPVILQDTGFSAHLPCGRGLLSVDSVEEAADAIRQVEADYALHSRAARDIAREYLDASVQLTRVLNDL
jgi:hypothetical protein